MSGCRGLFVHEEWGEGGRGLRGAYQERRVWSACLDSALLRKKNNYFAPW